VCKVCQHDANCRIGPDNVPAEVWCASCSLVYYTGRQLPSAWMSRRLWITNMPNLRPSVQTQGPSSSVSEAFGSTITRSSTAQERAPLRADPVMPALSSMLPLLELSNDPAVRQEFANLLQTAAPATQHHFRAMLDVRQITLPEPSLPDVPRLAAPPSVPQLGWHTPAKIPTPATVPTPAAPAAPSQTKPAAGSAAKAGKFIALAERIQAAGKTSAAIPRFLQELELLLTRLLIRHPNRQQSAQP
jgi:hypothetical protein